MALFDVFDPLKNITVKLTEEQLNQIIEWFDANSRAQLRISEDEPPIRVVSIEKFIKFLNLKKFHRRNFHYPTYAELMYEAEKLKAGDQRLLTKEQVIYMLNAWVLTTTLQHELVVAFGVFDTENRNFLEVNDIEAIVTRYGDVFNAEETRELLRDANIRGDGNVYYEYFVESMMSLAPELKDIEVDYIYDNPDEDPSVPPEPVEEEEEEPPPPPPPPPPPAKKEKKKK